jgi:hypothetical protein
MIRRREAGNTTQNSLKKPPVMQNWCVPFRPQSPYCADFCPWISKLWRSLLLSESTKAVKGAQEYTGKGRRNKQTKNVRNGVLNSKIPTYDIFITAIKLTCSRESCQFARPNVKSRSRTAQWSLIKVGGGRQILFKHIKSLLLRGTEPLIRRP